MEFVIVGSILLCATVGTLVGLKLIVIAARTRRFPELAIGIALFSYAALSQPAVLAYQALGEEASVGLLMGISVLRVLAFYVTLVGLSIFTWHVFGRESRWRQVLVAVVAVTGLISGAANLGTVWLYLSANVPMSLSARIGMIPHYAFVFGWVSLEGLRYYALMRRRRALGLADPVVTNRFFVWGAGEGIASLVVLALFAVVLSRGGFSPTDPFVAAFITLAGLVNALVWWLTFTPPTAYLRWVRGSAAAGASNG
jgi:hypothetical protein